MPEVSSLGSQQEDKRCRAAEALGRLGDARAVEPLIAALRDYDYDEDSELPSVAAEALSELADSRAVEPLIAALQSGDGSVRLQAARLLGMILDSRAIEPLIFALKDRYDDVRDAAALALGRLREPRAVEPLVAILGAGEHHMQQEAAKALLNIGTLEALFAVLQSDFFSLDERIINEAVEALVKLRDHHRAAEPLVAALQDESSTVRHAVAKALRELGTPEALAALEASQSSEQQE